MDVWIVKMYTLRIMYKNAKRGPTSIFGQALSERWILLGHKIIFLAKILIG